MKYISSFLLRLLGWTPMVPAFDPPKSVICVAPHTSNWDFLLGKLYYWAIDRKAGFLMKKEWFFFPLGPLLKAMGGVPIDRSRSGSTVEQLKNYFQKRARFTIAITPEGTRGYSPRWKTGFYRIALGAGVPILLAKIDYSCKEISIFEEFHPTGNEETDIAYIRSRYKASQACKPQNFAE